MHRRTRHVDPPIEEIGSFCTRKEITWTAQSLTPRQGAAPQQQVAISLRRIDGREAERKLVANHSKPDL
jgi:hypothetical protein